MKIALIKKKSAVVHGINMEVFFIYLFDEWKKKTQKKKILNITRLVANPIES